MPASQGGLLACSIKDGREIRYWKERETNFGFYCLKCREQVENLEIRKAKFVCEALQTAIPMAQYNDLI